MTSNQLTSIADPALPPAILNALQSDLKGLSAQCRELDDPWRWNYSNYTEETLAKYRKMADELPALSGRWAAVDRPASARFIATEIARLVTAFPNSGGADPDLFAEVVADDILTARPSYYALATAASNYRRKFRFLNIADLFVELEDAERKAGWFRYLFNEFPMAEKIKTLEADLPRKRKQFLEDRRRRKVRKLVWKRLKALGRQDEYELIMDYFPDGVSIHDVYT